MLTARIVTQPQNVVVPTVVPVVANVAALRLLAGSTTLPSAIVARTAVEAGAFVWNTTPATDDGVTRYNAAGEGSSGAGWDRIYAGSIDATWAGVTALGVADESVALRRAINAATTKGARLTLPPGTIFATFIEPSGPLDMVGAGRGRTTIKQPDHSTTDIITTADALTIRGVTFDGNKANQVLGAAGERKACIIFDGTAADLVLDDVEFVNTTATGFRVTSLERTVSVTNCNWLNMADANGVTTSYPNDSAAAFISPGTTGRATFVNCDFRQETPTPGQYAPAGVELSGTGPGVVGDATGLAATFIGCTFYGLGNTNPGIGCIDLYDYVGKSVIMGCRFEQCTGVAIKLANAAATTCVGNTINGQAWDFNAAGIYYSGAVHALPELPLPDLTFSGNVVKAWPGGYGLMLVGDGGSDTDGGAGDLHVRGLAVTGNTFDGCRSGIYSDGIADSSFVGNIIKNSVEVSFSDGGLVFFRCCGDILLSDNQILDSANPGLYCYAAQDALRLKLKGNTFRASTGTYQVYCLPLQSCELIGNTFEGTSPRVLLGGGTHPRAVLLDNTATEGTVSAVAPSGAGPTVTLTGTPKADNSIRIKITLGGALGVGEFEWSKDGGATWQEATILLAATYELGSTGLTAHFAAGTYVLNDTYDATTARITGLVSITATEHIHRGNSWDTIYGTGALNTITVNAATVTNVNLYAWGASVGDIVTVACDKDLQGMQIIGEVAAENGVKIRINNPTAGNITITDARFTCEVHKRVQSTFTPDDLSTLAKLWLAADYGVTKDGSDLVSKWRDKSRNDYKPAVQATGANQPKYVAAVYNGYPTLRSNDATDTLTLPTALDLGAGGSVVWAMKAGSASCYEWATVAGAGVISKVSGNLTEWINGADRWTFANNPSGLHIYAVTQDDAGNTDLYYDGAVVATNAATVAFPDIVNIFGRGTGAGGTDGDIPEFIACSGKLLPGEVKSLCRMLGTKYNVTVA